MKNIFGGINNRFNEIEDEIKNNQKIITNTVTNTTIIISKNNNNNSKITDVLNLSINDNYWYVGASRIGGGFYIDRYNGNNTIFYINQSGFTGLGNNTPTERLHINGNVIIDGNLSITQTQICDKLLVDNLTITSNLYISGDISSNSNASFKNIYFSDKINNIFNINQNNSKSSLLL